MGMKSQAPNLGLLIARLKHLHKAQDSRKKNKNLPIKDIWAGSWFHVG